MIALTAIETYINKDIYSGPSLWWTCGHLLCGQIGFNVKLPVMIGHLLCRNTVSCMSIEDKDHCVRERFVTRDAPVDP